MSLDGVGGSLGTAVNYSICLHFLFWIRLFISQVFQMTERERESTSQSWQSRRKACVELRGCLQQPFAHPKEVRACWRHKLQYSCKTESLRVDTEVFIIPVLVQHVPSMCVSPCTCGVGVTQTQSLVWSCAWNVPLATISSSESCTELRLLSCSEQFHVVYAQQKM